MSTPITEFDYELSEKVLNAHGGQASLKAYERAAKVIADYRTETAAELARVREVNAELAAALSGIILELQGTSGAGENYWEQSSFYRSARAALAKHKAQGGNT